jgi:cysteine-rich repeat protein
LTYTPQGIELDTTGDGIADDTISGCDDPFVAQCGTQESPPAACVDSQVCTLCSSDADCDTELQHCVPCSTGCETDVQRCAPTFFPAECEDGIFGPLTTIAVCEPCVTDEDCFPPETLCQPCVENCVDPQARRCAFAGYHADCEDGGRYDAPNLTPTVPPTPTPTAPAFVPTYETSFGEDLRLEDDNTARIALGFAFPFFGASYTSAFVSSNGFLTFGSIPSSQCCDGSVPLFLGGPPRIAPAWFDLVPTTFAPVRYAMHPDRAVITWNGTSEFGAGCNHTFQVQLFADGRIVFAYRILQTQTCPGLLHDGLIGITSGGGVGDPGEIDLSVAPPLLTGDAAVYEFFDRHPDRLEPFDVAPGFLVFSPQIGGGFLVSSARCGNGEIEAPEQCDDLNVTSGDGCSASCEIEKCRTCSGEPSVCVPLPDGTSCDSGAFCFVGTQCGAGVCQGGSSRQCASGEICSESNDECTLCGNGVIDAGEECEDGNTSNADCCSSTCRFEQECSVCDAAQSGSSILTGENRLLGSCGGQGTAERIVRFRPPASGTWTLEIEAASGSFYVLEQECEIDAEIACTTTNRLDLDLLRDRDYFVVIDGLDASQALQLRLEQCGDGDASDFGEQCDDGNVVSSDCCDSLCQLLPDGGPCSDVISCNGADRCLQGECVVHALSCLYVSDPGGQAIIGVDRMSGVRTNRMLTGPIAGQRAIAAEADGRLLVAADDGIVRVDPGSGTQSLLSAGLVLDLSIGRDGRIFALNADESIVEVDPIAGARTVICGADKFFSPVSVVPAGDGSLLVADVGVRSVLRVEPGANCTVTILSGGNNFVSPVSVQVEPSGTLLVLDQDKNTTGELLRVDPINGAASVLSSNQFFDRPEHMVVAGDGTIYVADDTASGGMLIRIDPASGQQVVLGSPAGFIDPSHLALSAACGNGWVDFDEECDDGDQNPDVVVSGRSGDCCSGVCRFAPQSEFCLGAATIEDPQGANGGMVEGWELRPTARLEISALGIYDHANGAGGSVGDGLIEAHDVAVWDPQQSTSVPIASVTVPAGSEAELADQFRYAAIPPLFLEAGRNYVLAAHYATTADAVIDDPGITGICLHDESIECRKKFDCGGKVCLGRCAGDAMRSCRDDEGCGSGDTCIVPRDPLPENIIYVQSRRAGSAVELIYPAADASVNRRFGPGFAIDGCDLRPPGGSSEGSLLLLAVVFGFIAIRRVRFRLR